MINALSGNVSQETAFIVDSYPYGRDRCRIRFWLESDAKKGYRFVSQTEHPKKLIWNAPKKSTYARLAGAMFQDEKGHVQWTGLSEYSSAEDVIKFLSDFPNADKSQIKVWCAMKLKYCLAGSKGLVKFSINGVTQEPTQADLDRYAAEALTWQKCLDLI